MSRGKRRRPRYGKVAAGGLFILAMTLVQTLPVSSQSLLPFEGTWRLRANSGCEHAMTLTRNMIVERRPGAMDVSKVVEVKRLNEMAYNLTVRIEDTTGHGMPTRNQILRIEIENGSAINGMGPYFDGETVEYLRCPDIPSPKAAESPRPSNVPAPKGGPAKIKSEIECRQLLTRTTDAAKPKFTQALQIMSRAQSQNSVPMACTALRRLNVVYSEIKRAVGACSSFKFVSDAINSATKGISDNNANMRSVRC